MRLLGQGEMHLRVAVERLASRFQVGVETGKPKVGYRETIKAPASARGRHKKQTGGHGQFGDALLEVAPLPRGEGFIFHDKITGGVVPRQYIPSVETGVRDAIKRGPLGFPVVDLAVTLSDGSYHTVNSSDAAFQAAARLAMAEALPKAKPVLLEPILAVEIAVPTEALSKATRSRLGAARADPRLRFAAGLAGLGRAQRHDPGGRDRRSHRRAALGDGRRRHLLDPLRPYGGADGPAGGARLGERRAAQRALTVRNARRSCRRACCAAIAPGEQTARLASISRGTRNRSSAWACDDPELMPKSGHRLSDATSCLNFLESITFMRFDRDVSKRIVILG